MAQKEINTELSRELAEQQIEYCFQEAGVINITASSDIKEAITSVLESWIFTAHQNQLNTDYYHELLEQCGNTIGKEAFTSDDGYVQQDVLCSKIPKLVEDMCNESKN